MATWFREASWMWIAATAVMLNIGVVANSVGLWQLVSARRGRPRPRRSNGRDVVLTASTTLVNAALLLPGWLLWKAGWITLADPKPMRVVVELLYLLIAVDLVMYWVHRLFHLDPLYRWFHSVHHTDDQPTGPLTLFVMHPLEASGFGMLLLGLMILWPVSVMGVAAFFAVNLLVGTVAHVPSDGPPRLWEDLFGGSAMHQTHHENPSAAFGFFSTIWDRVFGSFTPLDSVATTLRH